MFENTIKFIKSRYPNKDFIALHEPVFFGNEKKYLNECIDSTFVSSVGKFVDQFEKEVAEYTGAKYAIATVNGTAALHVSLLLVDVSHGDEVITQPLSFIATCNAIAYCNAQPIFIDVDKNTMGLSPVALKNFLQKNALIKNNQCVNRVTGKVIKACVPMHTFGRPCRIDEIKTICDEHHIALIEDAAESLGSYFEEQHTGTFSEIAAISFNGNKTITTGGGGMIITNNEDLAKKAKHITTTSKIPHPYEYNHDQIGFNYRLPNLNAALGCAQMECLDVILEKKRELAKAYSEFFKSQKIQFSGEQNGTKNNNWLNAIILKDRSERDLFIKETNDNGVMTRPIWRLMNKLEMFKNCQCGDLSNAFFLSDRVVNIPSGVTLT